MDEKFLGEFEFGDNVEVQETASLTPTSDEDSEGKDEKSSASTKEVNVNEMFTEEEEKETEENKIALEKQEDNLESKEDEEEIKSDVDTSANETTSDEPFVVVFAEALKEQGYLSDNFDIEEHKKLVKEKGEYEAFSKLFENEVEKNKQEIVDHYDKDYKDFLELKESGIAPNTAVDLLSAKEYWGKIDESSLEGDEGVETRKEVITSYFATATEFSDKEIDDMVDQIFDTGKDVEYAKKALPKIQKHIDDHITQEKTNKTNALKVNQEKVETFKQDLKETIDNLTEILPDQKINKTTKDKIYKSLVDPVKTKDGKTVNAITAKRLENPKKFDVILAALVQSGAFDKKWEAASKTIETKAAKRAKEFLENKKSSASVSMPSEEDKTTQDMVDVMKNLK